MIINNYYQKYYKRSFVINEGYYIHHDTNEIRQASLTNYFTQKRIPFEYGEIGKFFEIGYNFKTQKFENNSQKLNKWRVADIQVRYPKVYVLFVSRFRPHNCLYEFDVENQSYEVHKIKCNNCFLEYLDCIGNELWLYGWDSYGIFEPKDKFYIYSFEKRKRRCYNFRRVINNVLYYTPYLNYISIKSEFLWNGRFYPVVRYNTPTHYLYDVDLMGAIASFTNPHYGFADFEQLLKGPTTACGNGLESLKYHFNSYQYSGIRTFQLDDKNYFCQLALCPTRISKNKDGTLDIPTQYYLTIWNDSLNIIADIPFKYQMIDISETGAFAIRYLDDNHIIVYRYQILSESDFAN